MIWKDMEWKEVLKVSIIIGIITPFLTFTLDSYGVASLIIVNPLLGVVATGLVLNKKLNTKSAWGIFIGMIITGLVISVLEVILTILF